MELHEIVQMIVNSEIARPDEIAIIGKRDRSEEPSNFKYIGCEDISLIKNGAFKTVIVKDADVLKKASMNDIFRIARNYVLLSDPPYSGAIKKTDEFAGCGAGMDAPSEITIIGKDGEIMSSMDALVKKEKESTNDAGDFLLNFALIQNLKKQIAEKEKAITDKTKEIEIARNESRMFEQYIKNLKGYWEELRVRKDKEIAVLTGERSSWRKSLAKMEVRNVKELRRSDEEIEKIVEAHKNETNRHEMEFNEKYAEAEKQRDSEIERLKMEHDNREREIVVKFGRQLKKLEDELEGIVSRCDDASRKKDAEIENLEKSKNDEIEKLKREIESIRGAPAYKILSKIKPFTPEP
jgi:hypothetical protein